MHLIWSLHTKDRTFYIRFLLLLKSKLTIRFFTDLNNHFYSSFYLDLRLLGVIQELYNDILEY